MPPPAPLPPPGSSDDLGQDWLSEQDAALDGFVPEEGSAGTDPDVYGRDWDDEWLPDDLTEEYFPSPGSAGPSLAQAQRIPICLGPARAPFIRQA